MAWIIILCVVVYLMISYLLMMVRYWRPITWFLMSDKDKTDDYQGRWDQFYRSKIEGSFEQFIFGLLGLMWPIAILGQLLGAAVKIFILWPIQFIGKAAS